MTSEEYYEEYNEEYVVAVDGGATKTDLVLCTIGGKVLKRVIGRSSNPNDIGFEKSVESLKEMLSALLADFAGFKTPILSFYLGLSGGTVGNNRERYFSAIKEMLPNVAHVFNGSDALNALTGGIGWKDGMVLIAGTGSVVFARSRGKIRQVGGWGYLLDDAGSGYDLGRRGFCAVLREHDGRGACTVLSELYSRRLGGPVHRFIPEIYQGGKAFIASFAPLVIEAGANGDAVAGHILDACAEELALLVKTGARYLLEESQDCLEESEDHQKKSKNYKKELQDCRNKSQDECCSVHFRHSTGLQHLVVLAGGLWNSGAALEDRLKSRLGDGYLLMHPDLPPVYGAAVEAVLRMKAEYGRECFSEESCEYKTAYCTQETGKYAEKGICRRFYENFKESLKEINATVL